MHMPPVFNDFRSALCLCHWKLSTNKGQEMCSTYISDSDVYSLFGIRGIKGGASRSPALKSS